MYSLPSQEFSPMAMLIKTGVNANLHLLFVSLKCSSPGHCQVCVHREHTPNANRYDKFSLAWCNFFG